VIRRAAWILGVVIAICALGQVVVAAADPAGQDWPWGGIGWLASLVAVGICLTTHAGRAASLIAPAAAVLAVADLYLDDPYYFPERQRVVGPLVGILVPVQWVIAFASGTH
jgi:hypothetical protein